jgi:autotransporter-associated beta strand protein
VFSVAAGGTLNVRTDRVRVTGDGVLRLLGGASLPGLTVADISENGRIDVPSGTATVWRVAVDGVELVPGLYTAADCPAVAGGGTLAVNPGMWTGAGGDGLWTTGENWLSGAVPTGLKAVADVSSAAAAGGGTGGITFDISVTNAVLALASGTDGAAVTNAAPVGSANMLTFAADGVVYVGAGETLVLDHNLWLLGSLYKRGAGTLVLRRQTRGNAVTTTLNVHVEAGRVVNEGSMTNVLVMVGKPDRSEPGPDPEFVLADMPGAEVVGSTFVSAISYLPTSLNPGSGRFTQLGGTVLPGISWNTVSQIGFAVAGAASGATGTYHLAGGTLKIPDGKLLWLAAYNGYGVFEQTGGTADVDSFVGDPAGRITLTGGIMKFNALTGTRAIVQFGGGRLEQKSAATTCAWPVTFTGENGGTVFAQAAGRTLTLSGALSGPGGFVKEGDGALALTGAASAFAGGVTVAGGTVTVACALACTNDVTVLGGTLGAAHDSRLGTVGVTNGTLALAAGAVVAAKRLSVAGEDWTNGVYTTANCPAVSGAGMLVVGAEPGQWTGGGGDGQWSTAANWVAGLLPNGELVRADLSAAEGTALAFDVAAVTNKDLTFATGVAGASLTNAAPAGAANTLYLAADGTVYVGADETLVLDHNLWLLGSLYKRGAGTLVLRRQTRGNAVTTTLNVHVEAGRVVNEGSMTNVLVMVGKPDRSEPGPDPEFVLADMPGAEVVGSTFVSAVSYLATSLNPGSGIFTQNGGLVQPAISWQTKSLIGFAAAGAASGSTGTYHLAGGTLRMTNVLSLSANTGCGVLNQSGGVLDVYRFSPSRGEVHLTGGQTIIDNFDNGSAGGCTFYLGGGRLVPKNVTVSSPMVLTGSNGDMTFAPEAGHSLTLWGPLSGTGGFIKEGGGTVSLTGGPGTFTGTADIREGFLVVAVTNNLASCTNLLVGADAHLTLSRSGSALNTDLWLKVAAGGKVHLDYEGEVEVGHLVINGYEWPGLGRRYGSSSSTGAPDKVFDGVFTGTGVLKVVGPRSEAGSVLMLR